MEFLSEKIEKLISPFLKAMDVELVDLNIYRYRGDLTIQILADKKNGGITLHECSQLNRKIEDAIESENFLTGKYMLEVSSPGLDRPLRTTKDFLRVIGRDVRFFLSEPIENKIEHAGIVKRVEGENVVIDFNAMEITIPITKINKAIQII